MLDIKVIILGPVLFSKCTFTLHVHANRQTYPDWATDNRYWMSEEHKLYLETKKINVWAEIFGDRTLVPF